MCCNFLCHYFNLWENTSGLELHIQITNSIKHCTMLFSSFLLWLLKHVCSSSTWVINLKWSACLSKYLHLYLSIKVVYSDTTSDVPPPPLTLTLLKPPPTYLNYIMKHLLSNVSSYLLLSCYQHRHQLMELVTLLTPITQCTQWMTLEEGGGEDGRRGGGENIKNLVFPIRAASGLRQLSALKK